MKLGERIKQRLDEMRISQRELAQKVGVSPAQINHIIKGNRGTSIDTLIEIGLVLGIGREEIIRLYRGEVGEKTNVRKYIDLGLDRIERLDDARLKQVADLVNMIADSLQGRSNDKSKKEDK